MREQLFIADLHLQPARPVVVQRFLAFLQQRAAHAEALYILGDLFEVWLGDDEDHTAIPPLLGALKALSANGVTLAVITGNRDFLLSNGFAQATGCTLLPETHVVDLYGVPTLLLHGDTLCTDDVAYQTFRQQSRNPMWQQQFLNQSLATRRQIAQQIREQSQEHTQQTAADIMDVNQAAVVAAFQQHRVTRMIHGHTHRPAVHEVQVDGQTAYRYVVGDWHDDGALVVSCTPATCELLQV